MIDTSALPKALHQPCMCICRNRGRQVSPSEFVGDGFMLLRCHHRLAPVVHNDHSHHKHRGPMWGACSEQGHHWLCMPALALQLDPPIHGCRASNPVVATMACSSSSTFQAAPEPAAAAALLPEAAPPAGYAAHDSPRPSSHQMHDTHRPSPATPHAAITTQAVPITLLLPHPTAQLHMLQKL